MINAMEQLNSFLDPLLLAQNINGFFKVVILTDRIFGLQIIPYIVAKLKVLRMRGRRKEHASRLPNPG